MKVSMAAAVQLAPFAAGGEKLFRRGIGNYVGSWL
jgi:hypothetical protein